MKNKKGNAAEKDSLKPISSFGIRFRSEGHRNWFVLSMIIMGAGILMGINNHDRFWMVLARGFFSINVVIAIFVTRFGQKATELYSKDCIWWNGLLAAILLIIDICFFGISSILR